MRSAKRGLKKIINGLKDYTFQPEVKKCLKQGKDPCRAEASFVDHILCYMDPFNMNCMNTRAFVYVYRFTDATCPRMTVFLFLEPH